MPVAGDTKPHPLAERSEDRQRLATEIGELVDLVPILKEARKADELGFRPSTLSCWRRGHRVMRPETLVRLYRAVARHVPPGRMPDLAHLELLRERAAKRQSASAKRDLSAAHVIARIPAETSTAEVQWPVTDRPHEIPPVRDRQDAGATAVGAETAVPPMGDRASSRPPAVRSMISALWAHRASGRRQDILGLLWAAGAGLPAREVAEAADALQGQENAEVLDALLRSASRRPAAEVMKVAVELIELGRPETAVIIMSAAAA